MYNNLIAWMPDLYFIFNYIIIIISDKYLSWYNFFSFEPIVMKQTLNIK